MNITAKRLMTAVLAAALLLSGCSSSNEPTEARTTAEPATEASTTQAPTNAVPTTEALTTAATTTETFTTAAPATEAPTTEKSTEEETKSNPASVDANDYDPKTNVKYVVHGLEYQVPSNWVQQDPYYYPPVLNGDNTALLYWSFHEVDYTSFSSDDFITGVFGSLDEPEMVSEEFVDVNGQRAYNVFFNGKIGSNDLNFELYVFGTPDKEGMICFMFGQSKDSEPRYFKDFEKIVKNARTIEDAQVTSEEATSASSSEGRNNYTVSQEEAIKEAKKYLDYFSFSRKGLIGQLSSEYGSGFSYEDACVAVEALEKEGYVDWKQEACECAENYINYSAFSRKGLIKQLTSEYGEQFTKDEAEYAVEYLEDNNLVDWFEQAKKSAESYLEYSSFSRKELIEQLTSEIGEAFTKEQAEYAADAVGLK